MAEQNDAFFQLPGDRLQELRDKEELLGRVRAYLIDAMDSGQRVISLPLMLELLNNQKSSSGPAPQASPSNNIRSQEGSRQGSEGEKRENFHRLSPELDPKVQAYETGIKQVYPLEREDGLGGQG